MSGSGIGTKSAIRAGGRIWLLGGVVATVLLSGCDGCFDPPGGEDGGPPTGDAQLAFLTPLNGAVLTATDDLDSSTEGIQISVRVHLDPANGGAVKLIVDDTEVASADPSDGRATFNNVTLTADADGIEHTLTAEADGYESDTITVTARVAEATPTCQFLTPVGATVDPPFDVTVSCLLAGANEPATLRLLDVDGTQVGATFSGQLDGNLRFTVTGIDPEDGEYTLAFALSNFPATAIEKDITVADDVVLPDPSCTITAPTAGSPPTTSPTFDVTVECVDVPTGVTGVSVSLDGPTTAPVTFAGTLAASAGVMTAVVVVTAAESGSTEITAEVTNFPLSADTVTVEVPAFPVCDAEILQPEDGASNFFDVDPAEGNQILVRVGAAGSPPACTGATVEVITDVPQVLTGVLGGNSAQSGTATFVVTVPEGESTIRATLALNEVVGPTDTHTITFTTPPVGIRFDGIRDCDGFGDGCFNLADANQGAGAAYQRTLAVSAPAQNGDCPFTDPLLDVEGHDQDVRADGDTDAAVGDAWTFDNGFCEATFSLVTLHADAFPENVLLTLSLEVSLVGGDSETRPFLLGLDRISPTLEWNYADGSLFGKSADLDLSTALVDIRAGADVTGMAGSSVLVHPASDTSTTLSQCAVTSAAASCPFPMTLADGTYVLHAVGADAAGNALVAPDLTIIIDTAPPCVASIAISADADADGDIDSSEDSPAPVTTDVTVTFDTGACAIEDGRTATLVSSVTGNVTTASTSGNAVTFTDASLTEAVHVLSVAVSDAAANGVAATNNAADIIVDVTGPSCVILSPTASALNISNDDDGAAAGLQTSFEITTDGISARLLDGTDELDAGTPSGGVVTLAGITLAEGQRNLTAQCSDAAGNVSTSAAYTPTVDITAPSLTFVSPPTHLDDADDTDPNNVGVQTSLTVAVSNLDAGRDVFIYRSDSAGTPTGSSLGSATLGSDTNDGSTVNLAVPVSLLTCDACHYVALATDASGNPGVSPPVVITVQAALYVCTFSNPDEAEDPFLFGQADDVGNDGDADVAFSVVCPGLSAGTAELFVDDFATPVAATTVTGETVTFAAVGIVEGMGQVQVLVEDDTGSTGGTTRHAYLVDLTAPTVAWTNLSGAVRLTYNAPSAADRGPLDAQTAAGYQAVLSVTVLNCAGEPVLITSDVNGQVNAGTPPTAADNDDIVSVSVSIPDGDDQVLTASCDDGVGNTDEASITADVDTVPPAAPSDFSATLSTAANAIRKGLVEIDFTVPGDDGTTGDAASLTVVAAHEVVTAANFDTTTILGRTVISLAPTVTTPITTGTSGYAALSFGPHTWHVALRAADNVGNLSDADAGTADSQPSTDSLQFDILARNLNNDDSDDPGDSDFYGTSINTTRGDINGDGIEDLVIGAWNDGADCFDDGTFNYCNGSLQILYGQADTASLTAQPFQEILGEFAENLGLTVEIVKSIDGDDIDDLLVRGFHSSGQVGVYVYYGVASGQLPDRPNYVITDPSFTWGDRISSVGDVNGDGINDWTAGDEHITPPTLYLFFGESAKQSGTATRALTADSIIALPANANGTTPADAAALGNLNGDTHTTTTNPLNDFVVGDGYTSAGAPGRIYVINGRETWPALLTMPTDASQAIAPADGTGSRFGKEVSALDYDNDGHVDIAVKGLQNAMVLFNDGSGSYSAASRVVLAGDDQNAFSFTGLGVGDLNGDGHGDVVHSAAAGVWVFLGNTTTTGTRTYPDIKYEPRGALDATGTYLIGLAGDLDSDGFDDIAFTDQFNEAFHLRYGP